VRWLRWLLEHEIHVHGEICTLRAEYLVCGIMYQLLGVRGTLGTLCKVGTFEGVGAEGGQTSSNQGRLREQSSHQELGEHSKKGLGGHSNHTSSGTEGGRAERSSKKSVNAIFPVDVDGGSGNLGSGI